MNLLLLTNGVFYMLIVIGYKLKYVLYIKPNTGRIQAKEPIIEIKTPSIRREEMINDFIETKSRLVSSLIIDCMSIVGL